MICRSKGHGGSHWLVGALDPFRVRWSLEWTKRDPNVGREVDHPGHRLACLAFHADTRAVAIGEYGHMLGCAFPVEAKYPSSVSILDAFVQRKAELTMANGHLEFMTQRALLGAVESGSFAAFLSPAATKLRLQTPVVTEARLRRAAALTTRNTAREVDPVHIQRLGDRHSREATGVNGPLLRAHVVSTPGSLKAPNPGRLLAGGGTAAKDFCVTINDSERAQLQAEGQTASAERDVDELLAERPQRRPVSAAPVRRRGGEANGFHGPPLQVPAQRSAPTPRTISTRTTAGSFTPRAMPSDRSSLPRGKNGAGKDFGDDEEDSVHHGFPPGRADHGPVPGSRALLGGRGIASTLPVPRPSTAKLTSRRDSDLFSDESEDEHRATTLFRYIICYVIISLFVLLIFC